jgi:SAM-dependent methyltransferase
MEAYEYRTLFEFESFYWWYRGLQAILVDVLRDLHLPTGARVLDAGCGTGRNLQLIRHQIAQRTFGFDVSPHAAPFWSRRGLERLCLASTNEIPFPDQTFDLVLSIDVFESENVHETQAYGELWRVARTGGVIVMLFPAYKWLMTASHHEAIHASRRYSRREVVALMRQRPVELVRVTHLFAALLPAMIGYRLALSVLPQKSHSGQPRTDLRQLPAWLDSFLFGIVNAERRVLRRWNLPFGSSILAVARKVNT